MARHSKIWSYLRKFDASWSTWFRSGMFIMCFMCVFCFFFFLLSRLCALCSFGIFPFYCVFLFVEMRNLPPDIFFNIFFHCCYFCIMGFLSTFNYLSRRIRLVRITAIDDGIARGRGSSYFCFCFFEWNSLFLCGKWIVFPSRSDVNRSHSIFICNMTFFKQSCSFSPNFFSF